MKSPPYKLREERRNKEGNKERKRKREEEKREEEKKKKNEMKSRPIFAHELNEHARRLTIKLRTNLKSSRKKKNPLVNNLSFENFFQY